MRRKPGVLLPIELSILEVAQQLRRQGAEEFHGFQIAKQIKDREGARLLTGYGTLYRALERLQKRGFLNREWEDPVDAAKQNRPRRRLYRLTGLEATVPSNSPAHSESAVLAWKTSPP